MIDPDESYSIILELNRNSAVLVSPNSDALFQDPHGTACKVGKQEGIMSCATLEMVQALAGSDAETTRARDFILISPFLIRPISIVIEARDRNPEAIFFDAISAIRDFDKLRRDGASFAKKALTKCKLFIHWLCAAMIFENTENGAP